ncbi:flagellar assembly protein FliH [Shewanella psychromarinicola]|uniref:Flagellar assembly protein FliH n=1 Tax=Shewanella psychromarinicola TaxID=2487742 RepID=A0A3N4E9D9_9GAMM|nr:flagellar assembly protein FliH [Shewanella psychromarinicola]AZG36981.1 flagellar assembly protein FliH [Shewanella psychromarinicola]MCL1081182.1 flagellar assembly protein FliH [Shewanella psychromarinicola]RPA34835.1 flagellar assembly protein FliH [Shewanella psychromarinicola]
MPESKSPKNTLNTDDEQAFRHWQLPDMTKDSSLEPSNMFGKFSEAHTPTPVAGAEKSMAPPTMAQIEDIRAAAEQEGLEQGKQEGHQQGLEQGRLEGLEQGHQQGFAQGEQQGLEAGQTKVNELVEQLNQIINQFERPLSILDNEIEAELLAMTISLAKSVIGHELKTHPEHILLALRQGVDALPLKEQRVKLRLNQADAEIVNQCYSAEQLDKNQWQIDIDPSLSNGDCIIESVRSSVDLRVEQRINQVFSELDAQSNQLAKNVQQQKATHPQYQTTSVDNLSEHQQPPELTDTIDSTNRADNDQNSQSHTVDTDAEPVTQHIDAPDPIVDPQTSATLDTSVQADTVPTDKADDTSQQTKDLSQGNTDEHSSTSTT